MSLNQTKLPLITTVFLLLGLLVLAGADRGGNAEGGAAVMGVIKFDGPPPERKPIPMIARRGGKPDECSELHDMPQLYENVIVSEKGELANVFVYMKDGVEKKDYPVPQEPAVMNQSKCMFRPRVQGVRVGQEFVMRNSDEFLHNVRSYAFRNRAFNIAQPAKTPDRKKVFTRPERAVKMGCDIHRWMTAYVFAMEHPFFAVSNEKGQFKIQGLPAGEYTLAAWHEEFGEQEAKLTVGPTGSSEIDFTFKEKAK